MVCCTQYALGGWSGDGGIPSADHPPATYCCI